MMVSLAVFAPLSFGLLLDGGIAFRAVLSAFRAVARLLNDRRSVGNNWMLVIRLSNIGLGKMAVSKRVDSRSDDSSAVGVDVASG